VTDVRVRYAPSPTGTPHIGNIRTALFNWLFARHHGGKFILRIEDTDQTRLVPGALEAIYGSLRWLGLDWDEGPETGGPVGPYFQSERLEVYRQHAEDLVAKGHAYRCYCTPERLDQVRREQEARKEALRYDRACRELSESERRSREEGGQSYVIRFKVPLSGQTIVRDYLRGDIVFENETLDDHVLLKSDGWPTYQLANVVDDHLMGISHVMRGDEWISSAPKHVLEYQAFGWEPPVLVHLALILGKDRTKLSKRHGATDVRAYREMGYLPEALVNFLALLGWSPPETDRTENAEILSRDELVRLFDIDRVGVTPSVFDTEKLDWMNGNYIRQLPLAELAEAVTPFLQRAGLVPPDPLPEETESYIRSIAPMLRERLKVLPDVVQVADFFFQETLEYDPALLVQKGTTTEQTQVALTAARERLATLPAFEHNPLEESLRALAGELGLKTGQLFGALRVAVTGRTVAPPLFDTLAVLGRERVLERLGLAIGVLTQGS
jgi:glutamyl-tRNA synthetase